MDRRRNLSETRIRGAVAATLLLGILAPAAQAAPGGGPGFHGPMLTVGAETYGLAGVPPAPAPDFVPPPPFCPPPPMIRKHGSGHLIQLSAAPAPEQSAGAPESEARAVQVVRGSESRVFTFPARRS
jgi:hypothetical protein